MARLLQALKDSARALYGLANCAILFAAWYWNLDEKNVAWLLMLLNGVAVGHGIEANFPAKTAVK